METKKKKQHLSPFSPQKKKKREPMKREWDMDGWYYAITEDKKDEWDGVGMTKAGRFRA